ncbi:MAG: GAF domain-containing protein [Balneolaceae bacterium]|nr:GAF domain-containing protein [Balneolaceae bacterium]MCH8549705.1 GAF domain-containing protein [Balneolaceae bacterium]
MAEPTENPTTNGNLHKQLPKENLSLLLDTIEGINNTNEFKTVLSQSMEATRQVMMSEASSLLLIDQEKDEVFITVPTGPAKNDVVGKSLPKNKGIAGWVIENKKPYVTNDVTTSEHFYGDFSDKFTTRNLICVPLINKSHEVIGVVQALNKRNNEDFTATDIPVFQALASHVTIAIERTRKIDDLRQQVQHKDVMIAEIHHRVKNNLQAMTGQIDQEIDEIEDEKAKEALKKVSVRMISMARLHDILCERKVNHQIDLRGYMNELVDRIEETMSYLLHDLEIEVSEDEIMLPQEKALLCGLILNELLINIYKHAFFKDEEEKEGSILINLANDEGLVIMSVSDNGIGFPEDFTLHAKGSIGMWIVHELLQKLDAEMSILNDPGARFTITFHR